MSDQDAVLFANEAFYRAFAEGDIAAMKELWARRAPVACIHPGWGPLLGREPVMESREAIFSHGPPAIESRDAHAHVHGEAALVSCYEVLPEGGLAATNVFVREDGDWKLAHHHAGPTATSSPEEREGTMH